MYTRHGHYYPPTQAGEIKPQTVARCGGPGICASCTLEMPNPPDTSPAHTYVTVPSWLGIQLVALAKQFPTTEVCGYIMAARNGNVACVLPVPNVDPKPEHHFRMDPVQQLSIVRSADDQGLKVWGMYHSHPNGPAEPSDSDNAYLPVHGCVQAIVLPHLEAVSYWRYTNCAPRQQNVLVRDGIL